MVQNRALSMIFSMFDGNPTMSDESNRLLQYCRERTADANPVNELHCRLCSQTFHGDGMLVESLVHLKTSHAGVFESQQNNISSSTEVTKAIPIEADDANGLVSSSLDDAVLVEEEAAPNTVEHITQSTQTLDHNPDKKPQKKHTEASTQTSFSIILPIPEPLKKFLCLTEKPGICKPYECLICKMPITNLKIAVVHLMKKHHINLRQEAPKPKPTIVITPPHDAPQPHPAATSAKTVSRKTARKSIASCSSQAARKNSANTRSVVDQILGTMPAEQDTAAEYWELRKLGEVKYEDDSDNSDIPDKSPVISSDSDSDDDDEIPSLESRNNLVRRHSADADVIKSESAKRKKISPMKAKVKKVGSSGSNRHQLTKQKREMFRKNLPNRGKMREKDKQRIKKKKRMQEQTIKQSPDKLAKVFHWSQITFNSTTDKITTKPTTKAKNTARKSIRPPKSPASDVSDVTCRDVSDEIYLNSRFVTHAHSKSTDDDATIAPPRRYSNSNIASSPSTSSTSDVTMTVAGVKNRTGRKSTRATFE